jgi:hypothetical protein
MDSIPLQSFRMNASLRLIEPAPLRQLFVNKAYRETTGRDVLGNHLNDACPLVDSAKDAGNFFRQGLGGEIGMNSFVSSI